MLLIPYLKTNFIKTTNTNAEQAILQRKTKNKNKKTRNEQKPKIKKSIICNNQGSESYCNL